MRFVFSACRTFKNIILDVKAGDFLRGIVFVLMIVTGLLVFGCVGEPSEGQPAQQQETTQQQTGGQQTQQQEQTQEEPTQEQETAQEQGTGDMDLDDLTYLELAALGVPVKCEITSTYEGTTSTATIYMIGEDKLRMETPYEGKMLVSLVLGETMYVNNVMADMYPECEWLRMEETTGTGEGEYAYDQTPPSTELEDMPATDFECEAWVYDASKFTAPTENVCTMEEFNEAMMGELPDMSEYQ